MQSAIVMMSGGQADHGAGAAAEEGIEEFTGKGILNKMTDFAKVGMVTMIDKEGTIEMLVAAMATEVGGEIDSIMMIVEAEDVMEVPVAEDK